MASRATANRGTANRGTANRATSSKGMATGSSPRPTRHPGRPVATVRHRQQTSPLAIVSLVLGIVGLLCCGLFLFSIGALITGFLARKQIGESQGRLKGAGMATAGLILGAVAIVLGIVYWGLIVAGAFDGNMYVDNY